MPEEIETDEFIAQKVQKGDGEAFGFLIERYQAKLTRCARKFLSLQEDIEDLVQDVFIKAYSNIQSFDTQKKFSPWIYRIAHNTFVNELKKKQRQPFSFFDPDTLFPQPTPPPETADADTLSAELESEMQQHLEKLNTKFREPLILYFYENLSYTEIAHVLHIPTTTVGVRIKRGKDKLREYYQDKE